MSAITIRDYQNKAIDEIFGHWNEGRSRVLLQSPTGSGKTVMLAYIARILLEQGLRVLLVSHTTELVEQGKAKLEAITGQACGIIKAGYPSEPAKPIQSASVQSLQRRLKSAGHFDLIIIDECHHSTSESYLNLLKHWPKALVLGCSATPRRLDKKGFNHIFDAMVKGLGVKNLIAQGSLSPFKLYAAKEMSTAGVRTTAGDFNLADVAVANDSVQLAGDLLDSYRKHAAGLRCIVFAVNVAHSKAIASTYQQAGIRAKHLDGTTPALERKQALDDFRAGELDVLTNCGLFGEGVDIPAVSAVQLARPSQSLSWYLQACGRALRPDASKPHAVIIDHGGNWKRHSLPDADRRWELSAPPRNAAPDYVVDESGEVLAAAPKAIAVVPAQLQEISELDVWIANFNELIRTQKSRGYKPGWLHYQLESLSPPLEVWQVAAAHLGYKPGWAWHKWQECQQAAAA